MIQRLKIGREAGSLSNWGYRVVCVDGVICSYHNIVYIYFNGKIKNEVDHIDGDPLNNNIENLRPCTHRQNSYNHKIRKDNTSGIKGVCWSKSANKWQAYMKAEGKRFHIDHFKNKSDAERAIRTAREKYHKEFANHG